MQPLTHILCPVDFSPPSRGAARYARALAGHFHSELTLLHVIEPSAYGLGALELGGIVETELAKNCEAESGKQLREFAVREFGDLPVKPIVRFGDAAGSIVDLAQRKSAGLILMPTHGTGTIRRFILGSVTAKVLHDSESPVFTGVHMADSVAASPPEFRAVVCAIDLGPQSAKALAWAGHFASEFQARLTILHVAPALPGGEELERWQGQLAQQARERIGEIEKTTDVTGEVLIDHANDTAKAVCAAAARLQSDLLVIGRGSASGATGRLRANAYSIIRQSACPVVSV